MLDQVAQSMKSEHLDETSICDMIAKLPVGLEEMYNHMLLDHAFISRVDQNVQVLILQLVTQSARPLRLIEIAKAVEFSCGDASRDSKDIVRTACGPLLEIMEDEVVQILHHSFTEFLLDERRLGKGGSLFPIIDPTIAHHDITLTCLECLRGDALKEYEDSDRQADQYGRLSGSRHTQFDFQAVFLRYPLVEYATKKWTYHAQQYDINDPEFFAALGQFCDLDKPWFKAWLGLMSQDDSPVIAAQNTTPLHVAAAFGLKAWTRHLIGTGANIDALDSSENSPLFWAAKSGHAGIVDLLLKAGAKADIDGFDGLKPFHVAALRNHSQVAYLLLAAGVSPTTRKPREVGRFCGNAATSVGHHPLMYASQGGHVETVVEMVPYVTESQDLEDALCWAAQHGHSKLLAALLDKSDVSCDARLRVRHESISVTTGGQTALILATEALDPTCVRMLLEKGADVNKCSLRDMNSRYWTRQRPRMRPQAWTALHSLARASNNPDSELAAREILDMLLTAKADLEARDHKGRTPLLATTGSRSFFGDSEVVVNMFLAAGASPFAADDSGETLLHKTCQTAPTTKIAEKLLELGIDHSQRRTSDSATPLHCAISNTLCPGGMIRLLVSHGADLGARDLEGNSVLHRACMQSSVKEKEVLETLLDLGADVNLQNDLGQTCLYFFRLSTQSYRNNEDQLKRIIASGANMELFDREGKTALLHSITESNEALIDALLQHSSASLIARTFRHGKSVLHLACRSRDAPKLIQNLVDHGADPTWTDNDGNILLHEAAACFEGFPENIALVEKLIGLGVSILARNSLRRTALHTLGPSSSSNYSRNSPSRHSMVSMLLHYNPSIDVNAKDIDGYTPLHLASAASEAQAFNLLQAGADPLARAFDLRTPLHCAARARQSGVVAMILHFAKQGLSPGQALNVDIGDKDGRTPLHHACRSGRPESVKLLLEAGADVHREDNGNATPLMVCAEFTEEDQLWSCLRKKAASADEFRPTSHRPGTQQSAPVDERHHTTARVDAIASILLEAGARPERALLSAIESKDVDLVAVLRNAEDEPLGMPYGFRETHLMYPVKHSKEILDAYEGDGPVEHPMRFVGEIDEATMDEILARGTDFAKDDKDGLHRTALGELAALGLTEKMSKVINKAKLLDNPAFAKDVDPIRPPLQIACDVPFWNMDMLKLLVGQGEVDVNAHCQVKERQGSRETGRIVAGPTALHVLAKGDFWWQVEAIRYLIENGADVSSLDETGRTPLDIASSRVRYCVSVTQGFFKPQCCEVLLKFGANPNRLMPDGLVPLNLADLDLDIIKALLKNGADVNAGTKGVLISAIEAANIETLKLYLENGADCNVPDSSSSHQSELYGSLTYRYPLQKAALPPQFGEWDKVKARKMISILLEHGAKVDLPISDEDTLVHHLFRTAPTSVLQTFLERPELDFNFRDQKGRTVFLAACDSPVDCEPESGYRFIDREEQNHLRAQYMPAYMGIVESEMHGRSIDYLATDNEGRHMIHYLQFKWNNKISTRLLKIPEVRVLIQQKDIHGFSPLHCALKNQQLKACGLCIEEGGADLIEPDPNGDTALHHLMRCHWMISQLGERRSLVERYLSLGGDVNARNSSGEVALHAFVAFVDLQSRTYGKYKGDAPDWFEFFITHGADFQAANNDGETALHVLAKRYGYKTFYNDEGGHTIVDLFRRLVNLGCDPLQEDNQGRTALDIAAAVGNENILGLYQRQKGSAPT